MACFVSLSFSVPLCSLQVLLKGRYPRKSALFGLPGLPTTKTASYFPPPWSSNKGIFSVSGQHHPTILSKHFDEIVSCSLNHIAICNNVGLAYTEVLKLTWTIHDPLAFCPGKWDHQSQLQRQIALINWRTALPKFRVGAP
ncbi:uncharacterized protein LOC110415496 [Herrania umbratica]|uniref:Uncharacterized protein LOC110415496 n=1 Tax=Herrania umbratica TaxID=108875 RepID=A0A6J1A799_9ROSI|nr:uncharacterized protein LOC110415496 [Herrania umbratica]